jgi:dTDP-4-amino-4,6-dideoxygalactose transaminase
MIIGKVEDIQQQTVPLALPDLHEADRAAAAAVLESGWWTTGPKVAEFEKRFAEACGPECIAVAVSSATVGLMIAVIAHGLRGKRIEVPTWTYTATVEAIVAAGALPEVRDVDPITLHMTGHQTWNHASMPVHMAGARMDTCMLYGPIIEDAAHCLPYDPGGNTAVFSFYATKPIACGEGGMIVTKSETMARKFRELRFHGMDTEVWDRNTTGYTPHYVVGEGFKANMPDILAAIGIEQLKRMETTRFNRGVLVDRYRTKLRGCMLPPKQEERESDHLFIVRVPDRDRFIIAMRAKGVACGVHYEPIHHQKHWISKLGLEVKNFPGAESARRHCVSLPLWSGMTEQQQDTVITAVREVLT